jgi:glycosyltransferase involved in cell wall biosynthesis
MKLGLVIASRGRPVILGKVLSNLALQRRLPDEVVVSAVCTADLPVSLPPVPNLQMLFGSPGLTCQRNRGIVYLIDKVDLIAFIDDDFIVGDDYFLNMINIFEQDKSVIGVNGEIVADGANSPGFSFEEGMQLVKQYSRRKLIPRTWEVKDKFAAGCNGIIACRTASLGSLRFDERLLFYGWQEDLDFCGALRRFGRIVRTNLVWGVHLGTKHAKGSEVQLGYSQIINPAYIVRKGNMSLAHAFQLATRNFVANLVKSIRPESHIDRRGRLRGNLIGLLHLLTFRVTPEYISKLK